MSIIGVKPKQTVLLPETLYSQKYVGELNGTFKPKAKVFNIQISIENTNSLQLVGEIYSEQPTEIDETMLVGWWSENELKYVYSGEEYKCQRYDLVQNIFSRNTGILESDIMKEKRAFILGCGSVGSLVAMELARAGVGRFVLVDNDIIEYHNICRHQCGIEDVGEYKVDAVARKIKNINPEADVLTIVSTIEMLDKPIFDQNCFESTIIIGCADNRAADVYANSISVLYKIPFLSIGFWERAFAGGNLLLFTKQKHALL